MSETGRNWRGWPLPDDATLGEFGVYGAEDAPPLVHRKGVVWSPTSPSKPAGFVGYDRRREHRVYTTRRKGYHYYREGEGYAISDSILDLLGKAHVARVVAWESESGDAYEFQTRQYTENASTVPDRELLDEDDPQSYVPASEALHVWSGIGEGLHVEEFSAAMDRLSGRSGYSPK